MALVVLMATFASCSKCAKCTRAWKYTVYTIGANGEHNVQGTSDHITDEFDVCGSEEIQNAEQDIVTHDFYVADSVTYYKDGTGKCICITQ